MANLEEITTTISQNFSVAEGIKFVKPLGLFVLGLAIYSWFILHGVKYLI
jgi:hypothetical protein